MAEKKKIGELRKSQLLTTFGSGAIADFPNVSGIIAGTDDWKLGDKKKLVIREDILSKLLGKDYFIQPNSTSLDKKYSKEDFSVPIFRFPYYYYCSECGALDKYWNLTASTNGIYEKPLKHNKGKNKYDDSCNGRLVPSRFVIACENGHLEDFPYDWWVHKGPVCEAREITKKGLKIEFQKDSSGLDSIIIKCLDCGKTRSMQGCMNKDALRGYNCYGYMPWIGMYDKDSNWRLLSPKKTKNRYRDSKYKYENGEHCPAQMRTLQRTANNVYYPVKVSALTIPPWSLGQKLSELLENKKDLIYMAKDCYGNNWIEKVYLNPKLEIENKPIQDVFSYDFFKKYMEKLTLMEDLCNSNKEEEGMKDIIRDEYSAFRSEDSNDNLFKTSSELVPKNYEKYINQIKLVKRLREVQVLKGFRRITPEIEKDESKRKDAGIDRDFALISKYPNKEWLPAVELFGEGIFIDFKADTIKKWVKQVGKRYMNMRNRIPFDIANGMFSEQYVLLHTISHLLIRQLAYSCGYNTTSLKEKIYSTYEDDDFEMYGILIYTAANDSDGSLGGLVREGKTQHLENLFDEMLQSAYWCSNDPICIESESQGFNSLNYAACHACTLLPETSCVSRNCLLDRAAVVGKPDDRSMAFFKDIIGD